MFCHLRMNDIIFEGNALLLLQLFWKGGSVYKKLANVSTKIKSSKCLEFYLLIDRYHDYS